MRVWLLGLAACGRIDFDPLATAPLTLTPEAARANINSVVTLEASGGAPPYHFAIAAGQGDVDDTGRYRYPSYAGTATVEVRDGAGVTATAALDCGGDYIYVAGGYENFTTANVYRSLDGAQWSVAGMLPVPRTGGGLVVYDNQLFYIAGADVPDSGRHDEIYRSSDGVTWTVVGHFPRAYEGIAVAVWRDRIWVGGGTPSNGYTSELWSSTDGVTWQDEPPLPRAVHGSQLVPFGDELWLVAGHEASGQVAAINAYDGTSWRTVGDAPGAGEYFGATEWNGELWIAGGIGLTNRVVKTRDGVTWDPLATIGPSRDSPGLASRGGEMWIVGGSVSQPLHSPDGAAWTMAGAFPVGGLTYSFYVVFTPP